MQISRHWPSIAGAALLVWDTWLPMWHGIEVIINSVGTYQFFADNRAVLAGALAFLSADPTRAVIGLVGFTLIAWDVVGHKRSRVVASPKRPVAAAAQLQSLSTFKPIWVPRMELQRPELIANASELLDLIKGFEDPVMYTVIKLHGNILDYSNELFDLVRREVHRRTETPDKLPSGAETREWFKRAQQLMVLLKGNDVGVYALRHIRRTPRGWDPTPKRGKFYSETDLIIVFGPPPAPRDPDENDPVKILVDNGQPRFITEDPVKWFMSKGPPAASPPFPAPPASPTGT